MPSIAKEEEREREKGMPNLPTRRMPRMLLHRLLRLRLRLLLVVERQKVAGRGGLRGRALGLVRGRRVERDDVYYWTALSE